MTKAEQLLQELQEVNTKSSVLKAIELYGDKATLNFPIETYKELQDEQEATN